VKEYFAFQPSIFLTRKMARMIECLIIDIVIKRDTYFTIISLSYIPIIVTSGFFIFK